MKKIKARIKQFIFKLFKEEILATRPPVTPHRLLTPVKVAYTFETDPVSGVNSASYPLAQEQSYGAQYERGKRKLFEEVMKYVEVSVESPVTGRFGVAKVTLSVFVCKEETYKPASYDNR